MISVSTETAAAPSEPWGRVDEDGTVSVREGDQWRVVGQYPDATAEEALAYYQRKYADLAGEVTLLEQRHKRAGASPSGLRATAKALAAKLEGAAVVGDLAALHKRVGALSETLAEASVEESAAAKEASAAALAERVAVVEKAEALAARDPQQVQWKQATEELNALFATWQTLQSSGPRIAKREADLLWKRFRDARASVEKHRREFFSSLDDAHKGARDLKQRLIERAQELSTRGEDGIPAYRSLLDEWKTVGRAGKKVDDALWVRFKAAGDALFAARADRDAEEVAESAPKIEAKNALIEQAKTIADERDLSVARTKLTNLQREWDDVGRVQPREKDRALDEAMRKIETALRSREDVEWKRNNPETKARANDMARQLSDAIDKLQTQADAAHAAGDTKKAASLEAELETRRSWLKVVES